MSRHDELPPLSAAAESAAPAVARKLLRAPIEPLAAGSFHRPEVQGVEFPL
jgi:hypothetical protein